MATSVSTSVSSTSGTTISSCGDISEPTTTNETRSTHPLVTTITVNTSLYFCPFLLKGHCRESLTGRCNFSHEPEESIKIPDNYCYFFLANQCMYGNECKFHHSEPLHAPPPPHALNPLVASINSALVPSVTLNPKLTNHTMPFIAPSAGTSSSASGALSVPQALSTVPQVSTIVSTRCPALARAYGIATNQEQPTSTTSKNVRKHPNHDQVDDEDSDEQVHVELGNQIQHSEVGQSNIIDFANINGYYNGDEGMQISSAIDCVDHYQAYQYLSLPSLPTCTPYESNSSAAAVDIQSESSIVDQEQEQIQDGEQGNETILKSCRLYASDPQLSQPQKQQYEQQLYYAQNSSLYYDPEGHIDYSNIDSALIPTDTQIEVTSASQTGQNQASRDNSAMSSNLSVSSPHCVPRNNFVAESTSSPQDGAIVNSTQSDSLPSTATNSCSNSSSNFDSSISSYSSIQASTSAASATESENSTSTHNKKESEIFTSLFRRTLKPRRVQEVASTLASPETSMQFQPLGTLSTSISAAPRNFGISRIGFIPSHSASSVAAAIASSAAPSSLKHSPQLASDKNNGHVRKTNFSYARICRGNEPLTHPSLKDLPLCPYAAESECPFQDGQCSYLHGLLCDLCARCCLHPYNAQQQRQHREDCVKDHEREMELSFAIQRSIDKICGICMDIVIEKDPVSARRFGILEKCNHIFCLDCIRKWRGSKQFETRTIRACPECRVCSDFVVPSKYWVEDQDDKGKLIHDYKNALRSKPCKYFDQGRGECPFAGSCFYKHAYADGRPAELGLPRVNLSRREVGANTSGGSTRSHSISTSGVSSSSSHQRVRDRVAAAAAAAAASSDGSGGSELFSSTGDLLLNLIAITDDWFGDWLSDDDDDDEDEDRLSDDVR